jgi:hypothetical protein
MGKESQRKIDRRRYIPRPCWHEETGWVPDPTVTTWGRCIGCGLFIRPPYPEDQKEDLRDEEKESYDD